MRRRSLRARASRPWASAGGAFRGGGSSSRASTSMSFFSTTAFSPCSATRRGGTLCVVGILPFAGDEVFPLGRLREPLQSLERADAIVITRAEFCRSPEGLARRLRRYNTHAPIFHAHSVPEQWVEEHGGRKIPAGELPFSRVAAFCGLGNPESFWRTLDQLRVPVVDRVEFNDHHSYRPRELRHLAAEFAAAHAEAALTTEKD